MKNLPKQTTGRLIFLALAGTLVTMIAFWHHQNHQAKLDRLYVLNQGVGTCFNRIAQTFTAIMIKDVHSAYLNRSFMGMSDECLNETMKTLNPYKQDLGKSFQALSKLASEVHWFHESITRLHGPMVSGKENNPALNPLSVRFSQMENLKLSFMDDLDHAGSKIRQILRNDEILMGTGLLLFVLGISLLGYREYLRIQAINRSENQALNLLKAGQSETGAMVDRLVDEALSQQGLTVTAQVFRDYHGQLLESRSSKVYQEPIQTAQEEHSEELITPHEQMVENLSEDVLKTSLTQALMAIQKNAPKDAIQLNDVRDVQLAVGQESFEQMINAAVNKFVSRRAQDRKIFITNQIHADKSIISLFLAGGAFTAGELEFAHNSNSATDMTDMNLLILREMALENGCQWFLENKTDRVGAITGMNIRFAVKRTPKKARSTKNLVAVFKGRKKDLQKEMMN